MTREGEARTDRIRSGRREEETRNDELADAPQRAPAGYGTCQRAATSALRVCLWEVRLPALSEEQLLISLLAMAVILVVGRGAAEIARRVGQPEVLGELLGGFLLGPSVLGALAHFAYHDLFTQAAVGRGLSLLSWIGAVLLLLLAGIEVDLDILRSEAKAGALTAGFAIVSS